MKHRPFAPAGVWKSFQVEPTAVVSRGRMLAGLRAYERSGSRRVPTSTASRPLDEPVRYVEFVLDYRCGAAPEFRRVPFSAPDDGREHQHELHIGWLRRRVNKMFRS